MQNKRQIVIIESSPTDTLTKVARILKEKGYETVFVTLIGHIEADFLKESYSKIISFKGNFFKINLKNLPKIFMHGIKNFLEILKAFLEIWKLKPYAVIARATPNWLCALFRELFKKQAFIYFPYDIRSNSYDDFKQALSSGIPRFEIRAEKYCFERADGIIHKGDESELNFLNKRLLGDIKIEYPSLYFFPYCLKNFMVSLNTSRKISKKDRNIHVVYVGHVPGDKAWIGGLKKIIGQKIYLHLYSRTNNLTLTEEKKRIDNFLGSIKSRYLVVHDAVNQKDLAKEISKYDFGIYGYCNESQKGYEYATGNKISSYLEAGLPILVPKFYVSAAKIIERHGIGVVFDSSDFDNLKKILARNPPSKFKSNILKAREFLSVENQILRLEKFIENVRENKFKKLLN